MPVGCKRNHGVKRLRLIAMALTISTMLSSPFSGPVMAAHHLLQHLLQHSPDQKDANGFQVSFVEMAARAGLTAPITYGGVDKKKYIIETNGCGVAFIDYDNDGWMDILMLNGTRLEGFPKGKEPTLKLYHNTRNGSFTDATTGSGLTRTGWASAVTVGDYDNDGYDDVFITYWGQNALYHNDG